MVLPTRIELQKAILILLGNQRSYGTVKIIDKMAKRFKVTDAERKELTSVTRQSKFNVRIHWAIYKLRKSCLIENIKNKYVEYKITNRGIDALSTNPKSIDHKFLMQYNEYSEWIEKNQNIQKISKKLQPNQLKEKYGLITYIDMLGTRDLWKNSNSKTMSDKWNGFVRKLRALLIEIFDKQTKITFNTFSDTIIITIEHKDTDYLLINFGAAVRHSIIDSIRLDIPIRGCFSIGKFFHEKNFFVGKTVSEAAQYYEMPQWIGISASPSAHAAIEKLDKNDDKSSQYYYKCSIPLKQSIEQEAWAINWPELYESMDNTDRNGESEHILETIDKKINSITDIDIALKWRNTRKFYDDIYEDSSFFQDMTYK